MTLGQYIQKINARFQLGNATEHTFRGDLQQLIETIVPEVSATNEPKRIRCGAPDYVLMRKDIPIGYIEAKDIDDKDLAGTKKTGNKEQFDRYKSSLNNIIFTDYLDFHLFVDGQAKTTVRIGRIENGHIVPLIENFGTFTNIIKDFCGYKGQTIRSSKRLAEMMAGKARMLADVITKALVSDEKHNEDSSLKEQMQGFKDILIHDITPKAFADVYAQTIAYGMFAARLHDPTLPTFSRQEAAELIPKSNPFLRKLFGYIAGPDIDDRILWIVDDLVEIFLACNVEELLKNHGKSTAMQDPIIHFYETFLSEYDPALRKARGVWYTPEPVVNFIVRAVDDILKTEFDLPMGLADTSKTKIKTRVQGHNKEVEQEVHRVQILDPATGTGTFLAEVVQHIYQQFEGQQGIWSNYVENHLIPRLNGFELLMASYAMAHLKLDLLLTETGYRPTKNQRFRIYLTNSLEEHHADTGTLFANWLSTEANEANHIKRDTPVMCVIGNPPYSVSSTNKSEWIEKLTVDYKKDLNERNIQPLSDDYIKFIRFGQHFIDKKGSGILAYISNNSFVDGIIHRQMRKHLLESFDKIYILDLHGNAKKKEVAPDGSPDQNVFDIMQGVSINIFVKTGKKKVGTLAEVLHLDLQGKRDFKYDFLSANNFSTNTWNVLKPEAPNYFLVKKDFDESGEYEKGFKIDELFVVNGMGITTGNDKELIDFEEEVLKGNSPAVNNINQLYYRLFDIRYINYDSKLVERPREKLMSNFLTKGNFGLLSLKGVRNDLTSKFGITKMMIDKSVISTLDNGYVFPLYCYSYNNSQQTINYDNERTPNFNKEILNQIVEKLGLTFVGDRTSPTPPKEGLTIVDVPAFEKEGLTIVDVPAFEKEGLPIVDVPAFEKEGLPIVDVPAFEKEELPIVDVPAFEKEGLPIVDVPAFEKEGLPIVDVPAFEKEGLPIFDVAAFEKEGLPIVDVVAFEKEGRLSVDAIISSDKIKIDTEKIDNGHNSELFEEETKPGYVTANAYTYPFIKEMRDKLKANPTKAEILIWEYLRNKKTGFKIRRQHIIDDFITDFVCLRKKLVIEIDGKVHLNHKEYDALRTSQLNHLGFEVVRFTNEEVFANPTLVTQKIKEILENKADSDEDLENDEPILDSDFRVKALTNLPKEENNLADLPKEASPKNSPPLEGLGEVFAPIDLLDYIYAVLHSPAYREKYKEFLKIDFPRVPYPEDAGTFWQLVKLGSEIRQLHLLESASVTKYITKYPVDGNNIVVKPKYEDGKVYINESQYFENVPQLAWEFYIGGYQPAQKWLKDRKDRELSFEDILHYQKIIVALTETDRLMKEVDAVGVV